MKRFSYTWEGDIFLLHVQLNHDGECERQAMVVREFEDGTTKSDPAIVKKEAKSHRFMISRSHPKEKSFYIEYPQEMILEAYKLDDRAYFPTESFFVG